MDINDNLIEQGATIPCDEHLAHTILYIRTSGNLVKWQKSRRISTTYDLRLEVGSVDVVCGHIREV
jgi:hypothetical protein